MIIKTLDGRYSNEFFKLGFQANIGNIIPSILHRAKLLAPKRAKSFKIFKIRHTDYHGNHSDKITGYGSFRVSYFTTETEGTFKVH